MANRKARAKGFEINWRANFQAISYCKSKGASGEEIYAQVSKQSLAKIKSPLDRFLDYNTLNINKLNQ